MKQNYTTPLVEQYDFTATECVAANLSGPGPDNENGELIIE